MRFMLAGAVGVSLVAAAPAAAHPADGALNRLYEKIAAGVAANSGEEVTGAFAADAVVLDSRPGPPANGEAFRAGIARMAERLKADGVEVKAGYRVISRMVTGDVAVDVGYRRQSMAVTKAGGPVPGTQYQKFLVVAQRQADGGWKIIRDASLPASKEAWDAAERTEGLKYDL
jgi:ketosteroid isomerase-like protein